MSILDIAGPIIEKVLSFIPDPQMKAKAQLDLFLANQAGEFKEIDAELRRQLGLTSEEPSPAAEKTEASAPEPKKSKRS